VGHDRRWRDVGVVFSYSQKLVAGMRQRFLVPSQLRQCGLATLRMLVTGWAAKLRRSGHAPARHDQVALTIRAVAHYRRELVGEEQALTLDPANADALAGAAYVDALDYAYGWSDQSADVYARAMHRVNQALLLDPDQARAHYTKAILIMYKTKPSDAASANEVINEAEASLRADPSFAQAYFPMADGEMLLGRYEQSMSHLEQAMRISPRDFLLKRQVRVLRQGLRHGAYRKIGGRRSGNPRTPVQGSAC